MNNTIKKIEQIGIVPVVKITKASQALPIAKALIEGGIDTAEITFRSEHAISAIKTINQHYPDMLIGAGTVRTIEQAKSAIDAGARFIVTPGFNKSIVLWCIENDICILPGISTASEIEEALDLGITTLKFFPAESSGGAQKIKDFSAPYPTVNFLPTGGIGLQNMHEYLSLPNVFAIGGSFMLDANAIDKEDWASIKNASCNAIKQLLQFELIHIGINQKDSIEAEKTAATLCALFHFELYKKPKSYFAGKGFEVLNTKGTGEHGHIGIYTPYPLRAMYQLKKQGVTFNEKSITHNKLTNRINFVYLDLEIAGFGIHLINPDVKM